MIALILQGTQPPSAFLDPGVGWRRYDNVNRSDSMSTRITSTDARSFLIVRCDRARGAVVSIQFVPIENVGLSMSAIDFLQTDRHGQVTRFNFVWEVASTGTFARDRVDDLVVSAGVLRIGEAASTLKVTARDRSGAPLEQRFESVDGRDTIGTVVAFCGQPPSAGK